MSRKDNAVSNDIRHRRDMTKKALFFVYEAKNAADTDFHNAWQSDVRSDGRKYISMVFIQVAYIKTVISNLESLRSAKTVNDRSILVLFVVFVRV